MKRVNARICAVLMILMMLISSSVMGTSAATTIIDEGFEFSRQTDGTIAIHGYVGTDENVSVPTTLLTKSVTKVVEYAFMYNSTIKSMTLPTSITTLERGLFYGCSSLESVTLPKNCTQIGQYMFYDCDALKTVTLPSMLKEVPRYCFAQCDSIESITLPSTAKVIGDYAFSDCPELKSVYVSRYTTSISDTAFEDCPQVVIYGYLNTYAYRYAMEHSIAFSAIDANASTCYVTFYNYDGSVYQYIPVKKGGSVAFPSVDPIKPATDTHYYEFSYWDGNIINIQQNEFLYPVFTEHEIIKEEPEVPEVINKYNVVFLNGDDVFIEVQSVEEGGAAIAPDIIPEKASTSQYRYTFKGWDKDFSNITQDLIVRPVFEEILQEYTVSFVGADGATIDEQKVNYGNSAEEPEVPEVPGYNFTGWDKNFEFIENDLIVTATYEKEIVPQPPKSTGKLRIELSGGNSFTIAVNGGNPRPQGASYVNTKMPIGAEVTLVADTSNGLTFLGWMNEGGAIVSKTDTFTFNTTGNDYFKAVYQTPVEGVNAVVFKNDKAAGGNGQILDMQYYASGDEIVLPNPPTQAGYTFAGWSFTAEEIKAKLAKGEDVTVLAKWEVAKVYVDIVANGGTITTPAQENGKYLAYFAVTVVADAAPAGQKFAYWVDAEGTILSYRETYKFFPVASMELTAVYVEEDEVVKLKPLLTLSANPAAAPNEEKITYTLAWDVDASIGKVTAVGIIIVDKADYNEDTFKHGTTDTKVFDRAFANKVAQSGEYAPNKTGSLYDHTYVAAMWVQYTDAVTGESVTVYSPIIEVYKPAP